MIRIDASVTSRMVQMDVSHDKERCGVDVKKWRRIHLVTYRIFRHLKTQYILFKRVCLIQMQSFTHGACYGVTQVGIQKNV